MLQRLSIPLAALAVAVLAVAAQPASAASQPRPDAPNGRTITLTKDSTTPGGMISFTGTGYVNDSGLGQTVTVKLNDVDILGDVEARADGTVSGSVTIPATLAPGEYWLRFLSGTGKDNDLPASSVHATFTLTAAASTTSTSTTTTTVASGSGTGGSTTVVGIVPAAAEQQLVENGFDSATLVALGGGLVLLGAGGLVVERVVRRRRTA